MSKRRWLTGICLGSCVLLIAGVVAADPFGANAQTDAPLTGDAASAAAIALAAYPGTDVREVESEREDGRLLWEVALSNDVEVEIDLTTGEIVDTEVGDDGEDDGVISRLRGSLPLVGSDDDDAREGVDTAITGKALDEASAAALAYLGEGRVTDTEIGDEEGYYEIEVTLANGRQVDVHLDETFTVLSVEGDGFTGEDED